MLKHIPECRDRQCSGCGPGASLNRKIKELEIDNKDLREVLEEYRELFYLLDEAIATPEQIARDTNMVGGFVSGLDLIYDEEDIIERAIKIIKRKR